MQRSARKRPQGIQKKELWKLYLLLIFAFLFGGVILTLPKYVQKKTEKKISSFREIQLHPLDQKLPLPPVFEVTPPKVPFERDLELEKSVQDQTPFDTPELYYFLHWINSLKEKEVIQSRPPRIRFEKLWKNPKEHRGKFYHMIGTLRDIHTYPLKVQNHPCGVQVVYRGIISDKHARPFFFAVIEKERDFTPNQSVVQFYGIFVKILIYESRGGKWIALPFFVARKLHPYRNPTLYEIPLFQKIIFLTLGFGFFSLFLLGGLFFWHYRKEKAYEAERKSARLDRYRRKMQKKRGEGLEKEKPPLASSLETEKRDLVQAKGVPEKKEQEAGELKQLEREKSGEDCQREGTEGMSPSPDNSSISESDAIEGAKGQQEEVENPKWQDNGV